jgi:hypothetical protein
MGVSLSLRIVPDRIQADEWQRFYDDSLFFLQSYPGGVVDLQKISIERFTRFQYSRNIERNPEEPARRCWQVVGMLEGFGFAESFTMYASLDAYLQKQEAGEFALLDDLPEGNAPGVVKVFDAKTQGHSYHYPLLAVSILAEWRFPGNALVWGDLDKVQALYAMERLGEILGETGPLPLTTDAERLYVEIKRTVAGVPAVERFRRIFRCEKGEILNELALIEDRRLLEQCQKEALVQSIPNTLGVIFQCINWLNSTGDVAALARMACKDPDGPRFDPADFAVSLAMTGIALEPVFLERVAILRKPSGMAHTVFTQLGLMGLEVNGLPVVRSQCFLGEEAVLEALTHVFPVGHEELALVIQEKTAMLGKNLTMCAEAFDAKLKQLTIDLESEGQESLLRFSPDRPLSPNQIKALETFFQIVSFLLPELEAALCIEDMPPGTNLHRLILASCDELRIALPEDSWAWIDAEQDEWYLHLLICLLGMSELLKGLEILRTALMTHRELCVHVRKLFDERTSHLCKNGFQIAEI